MMNDRYLTIAEAAAYLRLSRETLYKYVQRGVLPAAKVGRHWRFNRSVIDQWMAEQSGAPTYAAQKGTGGQTAEGRGLRVLVVDDDPSIRLILQVWIRAAGHLPDIAENGAVAMELLSSKIYDLIFLDVVMPDLTGGQVLGRLQEYLERPAVVLMTAFAQSPLLEQALRYDILYLLSKPFTQEQVQRLLLSAQAARGMLPGGRVVNAPKAEPIQQIK